MAARKPALLEGFEILEAKSDILATLAESQAQALAEHPGWLPCMRVFIRPEGAEGPEKDVCFGTVNPAYIKEVTLRDGRTKRVAECPRTNSHNRQLARLRSYGWIK